MSCLRTKLEQIFIKLSVTREFVPFTREIGANTREIRAFTREFERYVRF
ncbi:hypothetical protein QUF89_17100 [Peribacillus simplex]|uniref:Uncharacterized protein n=1 Tax=Peribacillus simplex TaxID=1478 RepID=A0AAW7IR66_9BACI|nr:hypothetical protein [Peribacillus simplex]MDM5453861.1 hypothetical protein [Peribacillus simplex]